MRTRPALDSLNFLIADVQAGVGPFLAIYLLTSRHWDAAQIGAVMSIGGLATVLAPAPAGALVDAITWKRGLIVTATCLVAAGAVVLGNFSNFWPAAAAQTVIGACDAVFPPAIAAISLGIVGRAAFARRIGRNEAFNHAGNVSTAILAGIARVFDRARRIAVARGASRTGKCLGCAHDRRLQDRPHAGARIRQTQQRLRFPERPQRYL
jgi:MFS family permease